MPEISIISIENLKKCLKAILTTTNECRSLNRKATLIGCRKSLVTNVEHPLCPQNNMADYIICLIEIPLHAFACSYLHVRMDLII